MVETAIDEPRIELSHGAIREQLERLVGDPAFRSSKRSVQFLRYVVEQTLQGAADQIKERTIGVEVFGRDPSYDTNTDHVVRTAAIELRKRLAIYYGQEEHRAELRMSLVPGSYIPHFLPPLTESEPEPRTAADHLHTPPPIEPIAVAEPAARKHSWWLWASVAAIIVGAILLYLWLRPADTEDAFWKPVLDAPGPVLMAVGDVPNGPPTPSSDAPGGAPVPIVHRAATSAVPFADTVTIARVWGILAAHGKKVYIRPEGASSFSDLREGPVVLVGAFNNEWSLRLTRSLRYSLALDPARHLIYIKDSQHPESRAWSWQTDQRPDDQGGVGNAPLVDYALISRIWNSETGHPIVSIGGLYTYGTQAAGEFLSDPQMIQTLSATLRHRDPHQNLQIVLAATVTDGTPGPPRVLAVSSF